MRARVLVATVLLKILTPYAQKVGIQLNLDDVENLLVVGAVAWHQLGPVLERYLPPKHPPAPPATKEKQP